VVSLAKLFIVEDNRMQEESKDILNRTIKLVKWLSENPKIQSRLCEDYSESTPEECIEIIDILEENGFYDLIVILLMKNQYNLALEQVVTEIVIDKMTKEWERIGMEQMCSDIKEKIKEKINLKNKNLNFNRYSQSNK
jgi:hypothetical protein